MDYKKALSKWAAYEIADTKQEFFDEKRGRLRAQAEELGADLGKDRERVHDEMLKEITRQCRAV